MAYFTIKNAYDATSSAKSAFENSKTVLKEATRSRKAGDTYDIFLSHSFADADIVLGVKKLLQDQGFTVYVDWIDDPHLDRTNVTKATAEHVRNRMRSCRRLVYATSQNASNSKWMPWELGYFDGFKPDNVFILPLLEHEFSQFHGQEYLSLYPLLEKGISPNYTTKQAISVSDGFIRRDFKKTY